MRKLENAKRNAFFAALSAAYALYVPVDTNGGAEYQKWHSGTELSSALHTNRSAKDFFFPQTENLMDFKVTGKQIEIIDTRKEGEDFILFGVRGCDARSFDILDRVFLADPVDSYYQNRRAHGIIFSMACTRPAETCFCGTFGIDAANPQGDVVCYETADALYLDAKSRKRAAQGNCGAPCKASPCKAGCKEIRQRKNRCIFQRSCMGYAFCFVPRLRQLHLCLPHLSMLRH